MHFGKMIANDRVDMRGEVGVLTRDVVIQGEMEDTCPPTNGNCNDPYVDNKDTFGGHIKVQCSAVT